MEHGVQLTTGKKLVLGIQHLFAMFGATVLVPALTGLNMSVALICAGIGTLVFHFATGHKVPVFVGSSFAYIAAVQHIVQTKGVQAAQGGIIAAGGIYLLLALLVKLVGVERIKNLFPPIVTGPVIVVIGLTLAPTGIGMAQSNWLIALVVLGVIVAVSIFAKGFFNLVPILIGLVAGYLLSLLCDGFQLFGEPLVNLELIAQADFINPFWDFTSGKFFTLPAFDVEAITIIAPIAFVTFMEHIGDVTTNGSVIGKDLLKDPGLHRTLLGDGLATMCAGLLGGPANTTYSENTGVLAVTKVYNTSVLKIAAVFAVVLGLFGKFGAVLAAIPDAVKGGMSIMLFGMIASVGLRTLKEADLDFSHSRNLIVIGLILVFGLGMSQGIEIVEGFTVSGLFIAVLVGVLVNKVLPKNV